MTDQLPTSFQSEDFRLSVPEGDDRVRRICNRCNFIDYVNPKIVTGSVVTQGELILLCKRAIEPRKGFWTLPAGFMEEGESVEDGARREAMEEACADIRIDRLLSVYSVPRIAQVQIMFRAHLMSDIAPGPESEAVQLVAWRDIPWSQLAFPTVVWALTHFAQTRHQDAFAPFTNPPGTDKLTR
ncbi:NUDIX hydrolase [Hyphomonas sp.]|uniref:NUDIX hydrolase n=1 Tax=Hyphomonas sp. TaxID=87 RepID=UPI00391ACB25